MAKLFVLRVLVKMFLLYENVFKHLPKCGLTKGYLAFILV